MGAEILSLKRWDKVEYRPDKDGDVVITMELRRMQRGEARLLMKAFLAIMKKLELLGTEDNPRNDLSDSEKGAIMAEVFDQVPPEQIEGWFKTCVRKVGNLYIDDTAITEGVDLLAEADDPLLFFVLTQLLNRSRLSPHQVKASASPSTLLPATTGSGSSSPSPATSTDGGASPETSIVDVTPSAVESSSPRA